MISKKTILRIGILGCGAIGSGIAKSIKKDLKKTCRLTGIFDIDVNKSSKLAKSFSSKSIIKSNLPELIKSCDLMVEAVNAKNTHDIIGQALRARKNVLVMSVGKILAHERLFSLAKKNKCSLLIPSGAIAGLDALKAASQVGIKEITLTTRKPPKGLWGNPYLENRGIDLSKIKKETILFDDKVTKAVKAFPQNINVAAAVALASNSSSKLKVRIITSPKFKTNSHEIKATGRFGILRTRTDNVACPDNPKTSFLAVLSGIQTLKQFSEKIFIGT